MHRRRGFTLIELMVVVAIIAILSYLVVANMGRMRAKAKLGRVSTELNDIAKALSAYYQDNGYSYPADANRNVPAGLEKYLAGGVWPKSVWPHGVFDYDAWTIDGSQVYQISYRLCDTDDPDEYCSDPVLFPNFTRNSAILYCVQGPCVAHVSEPAAPAYVVNRTPHELNPPL